MKPIFHRLISSLPVVLLAGTCAQGFAQEPIECAELME